MRERKKKRGREGRDLEGGLRNRPPRSSGLKKEAVVCRGRVPRREGGRGVAPGTVHGVAKGGGFVLGRKVRGKITGTKRGGRKGEWDWGRKEGTPRSRRKVKRSGQSRTKKKGAAIRQRKTKSRKKKGRTVRSRKPGDEEGKRLTHIKMILEKGDNMRLKKRKKRSERKGERRWRTPKKTSLNPNPSFEGTKWASIQKKKGEGIFSKAR